MLFVQLPSRPRPHSSIPSGTPCFQGSALPRAPRTLTSAVSPTSTSSSGRPHCSSFPCLSPAVPSVQACPLLAGSPCVSSHASEPCLPPSLHSLLGELPPCRPCCCPPVRLLPTHPAHLLVLRRGSSSLPVTHPQLPEALSSEFPSVPTVFILLTWLLLPCVSSRFCPSSLVRARALAWSPLPSVGVVLAQEGVEPSFPISACELPSPLLCLSSPLPQHSLLLPLGLHSEGSHQFCLFFSHQRLSE